MVPEERIMIAEGSASHSASVRKLQSKDILQKKKSESVIKSKLHMLD